MALTIDNSAIIHQDANVEAEEGYIGKNVIIEKGVKLKAKRVFLDDNCFIGRKTCIVSRDIKIGYKTVLERKTKISSLTGEANLISIGDYSFIGKKQNILLPTLMIGDYTTVHNSCLILGHQECLIGHNCWIGQNSILNANKKLSIGNNVGIGTNSQIWTHVIHGELLEGCTMFGEHPTTIEDDVWIVGGAVVSPNLTIRKASIIMVGSVITKSTEPFHCYGGVPARDITEKIKPYKILSLEDKFNLMRIFADEFVVKYPEYKNRVFLLNSLAEYYNICNNPEEKIIIMKDSLPSISKTSADSFFSLSSKTYSKKKSILEEVFMKSIQRYKAKFIPAL